MESDQQAVVKFFEDAKTDAHLSAALAKADSESEVAEVARRHGYELDVNDIQAGWSRSLEAMDDTSTQGVSGGLAYPAPVPPLSAGIGTPGWTDFWHSHAGGAYEDDATRSNATVVEVKSEVKGSG